MLEADRDITLLATRFEAHEIWALHVTPSDDGRWFASFESYVGQESPEIAITSFLNVIESLNADERDLWSSCTLREFDIGYECGEQPWGFNQGLTAQTVKRIGQVGASLRTTLYRNFRDDLP